MKIVKNYIFFEKKLKRLENSNIKLEEKIVSNYFIKMQKKINKIEFERKRFAFSMTHTVM
jgi:hypothetical protein